MAAYSGGRATFSLPVGRAEDVIYVSWIFRGSQDLNWDSVANQRVDKFVRTGTSDVTARVDATCAEHFAQAVVRLMVCLGITCKEERFNLQLVRRCQIQ